MILSLSYAFAIREATEKDHPRLQGKFLIIDPDGDVMDCGETLEDAIIVLRQNMDKFGISTNYTLNEVA